MPGKKTRGQSSGRLSTINPDAAGIDIGSTFHVVAVPSDRDDRPVRTFRTFSSDLHQLADWLRAVGITTWTRTVGGTCDAPTPDETPGASRGVRRWRPFGCVST